MNLSPNFTLAELTASQTAIRRGIDNTPNQAAIDNLRVLCALLEEIREFLGDRPIHVSSGYRSVQLNAMVGGSIASQHTLGLAADFTCRGFGTPLEVCHAIVDAEIKFDQLIHEFGSWVHVSAALPGTAPRLQILTIDRQGARAGLHEVR